MKRFKKSRVAGIMLFSTVLAAGCSANSTNAGVSGSTSSNSDSSAAVQSSGAAAAAAVKLASVDVSKQAGFDDNDTLTTWSTDGSTAIKLNASSASISGDGAKAAGSTVTITEAGTYVLSGTLTDGEIVIEAAEDAVVHLVLNGVQISNADGPAIHVKQADKVILTLQEGTDNTLADGAAYADTSEEAPTAAVYAKSDLTINGTGALNVKGNNNDGITSKDDLKIMSGTINVKSADDGLIGKDLIAVKDGKITVDAGGDGLKTTNDTDEEKGSIAIAGGTFNITSVNDGIQAETLFYIVDGTFNIVSGGGSAASTKTHEEQPGFGFKGQPGDMGQPPADMNSSSVELNQPTGNTVQGQQPVQAKPSASEGKANSDAGTADSGDSAAAEETESASETESTSAKALKAGGDLAIQGGEFTIDAADDAIHSNANAAIMGGEYTLSSGDDGIHADTALSISKGTINVAKSYEGLESADMEISGGTIHVTASDDGVNIGGSSDDASASEPAAGGPGGGGGDMFAATDGTLTISGGYLVVDASGDGLDSNGSIVMSGGTAIVNGPTNSGNGALDYNGTFEQSGGVLIAAGSSGMAQAPSTDSKQLAVQMTFPDTLKAGTLVTLADSTGHAVAAFAPSKTFNSIVFSSPELKAGESYTISTGGTSSGAEKDGLYDSGTTNGSTKVVTFTLGDNVTYVNESGVTTAPSGFGGGGPGQPGQGQGQGGGRRGMPGTDGNSQQMPGSGTGDQQGTGSSSQPDGTEVNG
ncbi:carbohydrate-binding domain-containing protein [Paenibacillus physcomitrellae]|uniref:Dockerin type 1 n=1 Tax=Paenibacillus physcomitrellae TaxID=1619311 RepID=A0ABQ1FSR4_9BACL|nr:carbohydrate-binding domain-containing protein [Paenibacillus physcomitrellae]GGA29609.1 hypothetical protein GCM10010917_13300 [Paenibacillus physcomitrellae]